MGLERHQIINRREFDIRKFICSKCDRCLEQPVRCAKCLHNFCKKCIFTQNRVENELVTGWCPVDKQPIRADDIIDCSTEIKDLERKFLVNCRSNPEHGTFKLNELPEHEAFCIT